MKASKVNTSKDDANDKNALAGSIYQRLFMACIAARKAGRYLLKQFSSKSYKKLFYKGKINVVTECDLEAQSLISETILTDYPTDAILAEENPDQHLTVLNSHCWVIDPLDGTTNFAHGFPHFCVSIAYQYAGKVALGVVYSPTEDELFFASRGDGAYLNNSRIQVSQTADLDKAIISSGFPYDMEEPAHNNLLEWSRLTPQIRSPRCLGAAAIDLCYVACGRTDAHWEFGLSPWDVAAGSLIVTEAGGLVTNTQGTPFNLLQQNILASNQTLYPHLLQALSKVAN